MESISAIHGLVLSAWAFAGLTGNQLASFIVNKVQPVGEEITVDGHIYTIRPDGYQAVLYVTIALYAVALLVSIFLVDHKKKAKEA